METIFTKAVKLSSKILGKYAIVFMLFLLIVVFSIINPAFISGSNLLNILVQNSYIIIMTVGLTFVMISGGIDLSIGYQISLVGVFVAGMLTWWNLPVPIAIIGGLALGTLLGMLNGFLYIKLKVHSMIVTLATMAAFKGISYIISNSNSIFGLPKSYKFIGQGYIGPVPFPIILSLVVILLATFLLKKTYFGRFIHAVGGNEETARLAGIKIKKIKVSVFAICGFFVAMAAIIMVARAGSTNSSVGAGTEFSCITAAVLGGVSLKGGAGEVWGVVIGALIMGVLTTGMQIIGLGVYPQYIAQCIILLGAVTFDTYQKRIKI